MKVSISGSLTTVSEFRVQCERMKKAGFDAMDFGLYRFYPSADVKVGVYNAFFEQSIEELKAYFAPFKQAAVETGIEISLMHAVFPSYQPVDADFDAYHREVMKKNIILCGFFGCRYMVVHPYTIRDRLAGGGFEAEYAINMELYRSLLPLAKENNVTICLENMFHRDGTKCLDGSCAHADEAVRYIDELNAIAGEERFGFCFDCGHAALCGVNVYDYIHTLGSRLKALHLHDNQGFNDDHLQPYAGRMHWDYLLTALREIGYTGDINFETAAYQTVLGKPVPDKVQDILLKYIADIGYYFAEEIRGG